MVDYKSILYCTDYSEDAEIAFLHAKDLAKRHRAKLTVLHCPPSAHRYSPTETKAGPRPDNGWADTSPEMLAKLDKELRDHYAPRLGEMAAGTEFVTRVGTPFVEIMRYAREHGVDLIVMGAAGASAAGDTHYGSTVEQVSRRAHCTVMAIRNPERTYTL